MKPQKHSELIKSWADGAKIQEKYFLGHEWIDSPNPTWNDDWEYRIKPEPKPDVVEYMYVENAVGRFFVSKGKQNIPNLKLTFDGETGELKSAEVLK